ncbi:hypothetical protein [Ilumatobacter sp.]|uniref:hypothetical protein n=1 Tax=Ilumatobacter sp. TaxID=1967498 RepID=UPI003AF5F217
MTAAHATVEESLRIHGQLGMFERESLIEHWAKLDTRLRSFEAGTVRLDLYIKERGTASQHLTLEAHIERLPTLVATAGAGDFGHELNVVRDEMIRLISDARDQHRARRRR